MISITKIMAFNNGSKVEFRNGKCGEIYNDAIIEQYDKDIVAIRDDYDSDLLHNVNPELDLAKVTLQVDTSNGLLHGEVTYIRDFDTDEWRLSPCTFKVKY